MVAKFSVVPLPLLPDALQTWLYWQPLRGLADVPFRIYTGHIPVATCLDDLALQFAWTGLLVLAGHRLLARGLGRLVVQGG